MTSANFEFLRRRPEFAPLADLGGLAEGYALPDPVAAAVKLRTFAETLTRGLYACLRLHRRPDATLHDLLDDEHFKAAVPGFALTLLHAIRKEGNAAAHGQSVTTAAARWTLRQAFTLASWLHVAHAGGRAGELPDYAEPSADDPAVRLAAPADRRAAVARLAEQERRIGQLLADLESARTQATEAAATAAELQALREAGQAAADTLHLDELTTRRRVIDRDLLAAGWDVGVDGRDTAQVRQEVTLPGTGERADYVLFADDLPLAVVEAKRAVVGAETGLTQGTLYADALEAEYGVRPFVLTADGCDIWFWNRPAGEPPRKLYGFPSADTLAYRRFQLAERWSAAEVAPAPGIIDARLYQREAVRRVVERFGDGHRKALIVQATGTGKTRVAVALASALSRARWARRVLFLCDRRALLTQAERAFKQFLDDLPRCVIGANSAGDTDKRIYLATYPAMMAAYRTFDVGFFDLVIADETHRSIYNRYRELFGYFDALQVGLTATPVGFVSRNTFRLFGCDSDRPTFDYTYAEAVANDPPYLVPFRVEAFTTEFLRAGIKYAQLSREQREQVDEAGDDPAAVDHDADAIDARVFNRDTNRLIVRNLMERGIKDATGSRVGKTIVFARNYEHAKLLKSVFDELYPQYGGTFCQLITSHDPRAEHLLEDCFRVKDADPVIAVSVDMLDTGVDVPEVVNLVFAKPVFSFTKFWQMIGRGTRLCPDLFGPGRHKTEFLVFDHWGNFDWFGQNRTQVEPPAAKPLMRQVFEARVALADAALAAQDVDSFRTAVSLLRGDLLALPTDTVAVRDKRRVLGELLRDGVLDAYAPATRDLLLREVAPLMQWIDIGRHGPAHQFDRLIADTQGEVLAGTGTAADRRAEVQAAVAALQVNLPQVAEKLDLIRRVRGREFWEPAGVAALEALRGDLRGVMHLTLPPTTPVLPPKVYDIAEDASKTERTDVAPPLPGHEFAAYRGRLLAAIARLPADDPALRAVRAGDPVADDALAELAERVRAVDPSLDLADLTRHYPAAGGRLDRALRAIAGVDADAVRQVFAQFAADRPGLSALQVRFLDLLANHIGRAGGVTLDALYVPPFSLLHPAGLDGVFPDPLDKELLAAVAPYTPPEGAA